MGHPNQEEGKVKARVNPVLFKITTRLDDLELLNFLAWLRKSDKPEDLKILEQLLAVAQPYVVATSSAKGPKFLRSLTTLIEDFLGEEVKIQKVNKEEEQEDLLQTFVGLLTGGAYLTVDALRKPTETEVCLIQDFQNLLGPSGDLMPILICACARLADSRDRLDSEVSRLRVHNAVFRGG